MVRRSFLWSELLLPSTPRSRRLLHPGPWKGIDPFRPSSSRSSAPRRRTRSSPRSTRSPSGRSRSGRRRCCTARCGATARTSASVSPPRTGNRTSSPNWSPTKVSRCAPVRGRHPLPGRGQLRPGTHPRSAPDRPSAPPPPHRAGAPAREAVPVLRLGRHDRRRGRRPASPHRREGGGGRVRPPAVGGHDRRSPHRPGPPFSCAPLPYADMPDDLRREFAEADVTLMKGDLNYRRLVGDRRYPATTPSRSPPRTSRARSPPCAPSSRM